MDNKLVIGMEPGLRKAGNSFVDLGVEKRFTEAVQLNEGRDAEFVKEVRVIVGCGELEEFGGGHRAT